MAYYSKHPRALSKTLDRVIKPVYAKRGFAGTRLITDWQKIVGPLLADMSSPKKLYFYGEHGYEGVLEVQIYDSGLATELVYLEPIILERIATYFGYRAVGKLKIIQCPRLEAYTEPVAAIKEINVSEEKKSDIHAMLDGITDEAMRESLQSLGEAIFSD